MEQTKYPLWENRKSIGKPPVSFTVALVALTIILSSVTAGGFGGMFCTGLAGCAFAFLLVLRNSIIPWITLPLSFGVAFILSGDILLSLCILLYVPIGIVLAYCLFTERNLSVTVAALTVVTLVAMAAIFTVSLVQLYSAGIQESYKTFAKEAKESLFEMFSMMKVPTADGESYILPEETVAGLIEAAIMVMPAVIVVTCELLAYVTAKIFRAISKRLIPVFVLEKENGITVSVPCAFIYLISVGVSFFATEASVVAYSALNLAFILMPFCAVFGFVRLLGKGGIMRNKLSGKKRGILIAVMAFLIILSPISFIQMLSTYACIFVIFKAYFERKKKSEQD